MSIDERLRDTLLGKKYMQASVDPTLIPEIISAFEAEGWRNTSHYEEVNIAVDSDGIAYPAMKRQPSLMTGQEFFNRFRTEMRKHGWEYIEHDQIDGVLEAAKKAAGIN